MDFHFCMTINIAIYVYDNVEVLDFAGPYEVFTCATRVKGLENPKETPAFKVFTISSGLSAVYARAGLRITPDYDLVDHPHIDVLIVAGGVVTEELAKQHVSAWIQRAATNSSIVASVCTGAFLLARAGLLTGKQATTHWEDQRDLQEMFPNIDVIPDRRWVDEGNIITSGGISAGIDMSLHIVERLMGRSLAERTARQMEFDWTENPVN